MSGTPKYSQAAVDRRRALAIEARRREAAAEEERKRAARAAEERRRQFEVLRDEVTGRRHELSALLGQARSQSCAAFAGTTLADAQRAAELLEREGARASTPAALHHVDKQVAALAQRVLAALTQARAAERAEQLRQANEQKRATIEMLLGQVEARLSGLEAAVRARFDPQGQGELDQQLAAAVRLRDTNQLDATLVALQALDQVAQRHAATVATATARHGQALEAARESYEQRQSLVAGLSADPILVAWCGDALARQGAAVNAVADALHREDFATVDRLAAVIDIEADALVAAGQARQLREDHRAYIVEGLLQVLAKEGFQVATPDLLRAGDFDSDVVIRASREAGRRRIDVQIPVDGRVAYVIDGYEHRIEHGADGSTAATCDEAEQRLAEIHAQLAAEFGIEMGELQWEHKDPKRLEKGALDLPTGSPNRTQTRGGKA